jgi:hypothetical protein
MGLSFTTPAALRQALPANYRKSMALLRNERPQLKDQLHGPMAKNEMKFFEIGTGNG